jgi:hypothetical protein
MKKIITAIILTITLAQSGCVAAAVGYAGYKVGESRIESARIQAAVEREKIQLERDKAGL